MLPRPRLLDEPNLGLPGQILDAFHVLLGATVCPAQRCHRAISGRRRTGAAASPVVPGPFPLMPHIGDDATSLNSDLENEIPGKT